MHKSSEVHEPHQPHCNDVQTNGDAPANEEELLLRIARLERRLRLLRADLREDPLAKADAYQQLEAELLEVSGLASRLRPELGGSLGHALLADVTEWRNTSAEAIATEAAEVVEAFASDLVEDEISAWETEATAVCGAQGDINACFDALMRTTLLEFELEAHPAELESVHRRFDAIRLRLRDSFCERLATQPPAEELLAAWTKRLTDRAETMLAAVDDLPARRGTLQVRQVADDLSWFLQRISCSRGQRRRLRRKLWRLRSEHQERSLQVTLEQQFGQRAVGWFDTLIVVLIFVVLGLLIVEMTVDMEPATLFWLHVADAACCAVFLWEFFYKLAHVPGKLRWFLRHFLIDLVPSIPLGLIFTTQLAGGARGMRAVRLIRFARFARYFRVLAFLTRGIDRLARQYGRLFNRNVILYPTRAERFRARHDAQSAVPRAQRLRAQLRESWKRLLAQADDEAQPQIVLARLRGWQTARAAGWTQRSSQGEMRAGAAREIPAEAMLRRLAAMSPQEVEDSLGEDLASRIARIVRMLARPPFRWLPVIRPYVPRITAQMSDTEIAAAAARSVAAGLRRHHERWLWFADLYGTVSPSQFVDRVGTMMVRSSFRPAYRLALFGGIFLVVEQLLAYVSGLRPIYDFLNRTVGPALMLLGGVCFVVLGIGWWLKRLAREATEFYERAAQAQFLPLTESIRTRSIPRAVQALHGRVLQPEWKLQSPGLCGVEDGARRKQFEARVRASLLGAPIEPGESGSDALDRVVLLYRDSLGGAMYVDNDTRTTSQLLGNPSIEQVLSQSHRVGRRLRKQLSMLDLERQKSLFGGPYLWFNFISRSIAHSVACLIVDYNRHAVPLEELPLVTPDERQRYQAWLQAEGPGSEPEAEVENAAAYVTTAFTALHFLDFDLERDHDVEHRFGPAVLSRLRRDRSQLIRRVFGTYPLHRLPKDQRILNMYAVYENWLSGGRALFLPLFLLVRFAQYIGKFLRLMAKAVGEIRSLKRRADADASAEADFMTAVRKIGRMRSPVVFAAIRLRVMMDPEYLGINWPGQEQVLLDPQLDADLRFLDAEPEDVLPLRQERRRAEADVARLSKLLDSGLLARAATAAELPPDCFGAAEHVRAATVAYLADYNGVRSMLSSWEIMDEVFSLAQLDHVPLPRYVPRPRLWHKFKRFWREYRPAADGERDTAAKLSAWAAVVANRDGVRRALDAWDRLGVHARTEGESCLGNLLRHPSRISEQLVTIRTIQTLAMLDVLDYREHVFQLGQYAETGDEAADLLSWDAVEASPTAEWGELHQG